MEATSSLIRARLCSRPCELLIHVGTKLYKTLAAAVKAQVAPKGCTQALPSHTFRQLVDATNATCTPATYEFIISVQQEAAEQENGATNEGGILI